MANRCVNVSQLRSPIQPRTKPQHHIYVKLFGSDEVHQISFRADDTIGDLKDRFVGLRRGSRNDMKFTRQSRLSTQKVELRDDQLLKDCKLFDNADKPLLLYCAEHWGRSIAL